MASGLTWVVAAGVRSTLILAVRRLLLGGLLVLALAGCAAQASPSGPAPQPTSQTRDPKVTKAEAEVAQARAEEAKAKADKAKADADAARTRAARERTAAANERRRPVRSGGTITATTPCRRMHALGVSYVAAYDAWLQAGAPSSWDADHDGFPCENSYGQLN